MKPHLGTLLVIGAMVAAAPLAAGADTYKVDGMHSMPAFTFRHLNLSSFRGRFDKLTGTIVFDAAQHSGSADIVIDIDSVSTGVPMLDQFLKGPKFFDTTRFPTATFKSSSFKFSGSQLVAVSGDLNLHGVTKAVVLEVGYFSCHEHPLLKVAACGADASATIKRSDFGLDIFIGNDSDEVKLDIAVEALLVPPA
jgi:polyisoprenoid-binding protein YceI